MKITEVLRTAGIMLALAASQLAVAEDEAKEAELETVVVTASRTEESIKEVGSSITVISRADIEKSSARSLQDLLRRVPGLTVAQSGGFGKITSVFIRGSESRHTVVLVDGVRVNSNTSLTFDFSSFPVSNIERIEVLRGPQSGIHGADALGGVINIITKKGQDGFAGEFTVEAGNKKYSHSRLSVSGGNKLIDFSTSLDFSEAEFGSAAWDPASKRDDDSYRGMSFSQHIGLNYSESGRAELFYRHNYTFNDIDAGAAFDSSSRYTENYQDVGQFKVTQGIMENWVQEFSYQIFHEKGLTRDSVSTFSNAEIVSDSERFDTNTKLTLLPNYQVIFGYTYEDRHARYNGWYEKQFHMHSGYLLNKLSFFERIFLTLSARYDDFDDYGNEDTYKAGVSYFIDETSTRFHGSYGTGFQVPSSNDIASPSPANPDLKPTKMVGYDFGIEQTMLDQKLTIDITYFHNDYDNLVFWRPGVPWWSPVNIDARNSGVETQVRIAATPDLSLNLGHTYTDTDDITTGRRLARRPLNQFQVGIDYTTGKLTSSLSMVAVRDRVDSWDNDMDNYERWDLSLNYQATDTIRPFLRVQNLFDANYEEVTGYTSPGINGSIGVTVTF